MNKMSEKHAQLSLDDKILGLEDLYEILPFCEKKIRQLIASGELPVMKVGRDYITTKKKIFDWVEKNIGLEAYY